MACSKLFSGDLPEISSDIINYLRNDFNTLYSFVLVNRFWCRLAIPLLWEDPFSIKYRENSPHFIDTYFLFLNDNDKNEVKRILKSYKFDSNLQQPLFNYPSLIKTLNLYNIHFHVLQWSHSDHSDNTTSTSSSIDFVQPSSNQLLDNLLKEDMSYERKRVISINLFKLFIENNASLNNLYIFINSQNMIFYYICDMILDNPKLISEIEIFSFEYYKTFRIPLNPNTPNFKLIQTFLSSLPLLTSNKHIKHINISTNILEIEKNLTNIIQSQTQLFSIKTKLPKVPILNSLKYSSNTLNSITFSSCWFSNSMEFDALCYLTKLESLQFKNCRGLNLKVFQPFLNITTPLNIKTFVFTGNRIEEFTSVQLFIQKIGPYLENLVLDVYEGELRRNLFNAIIDFCQNIRFLHLYNIEFINISQLSKMIVKFNNYLKYLTLEVKYKYHNFYYNAFNDGENCLKVSSLVLEELSKSLPLSLHYLDLNLEINQNDLKSFFEKIKQVKFKRLLIRNRSRNNVSTTLEVIRDFVKESNLEFLAYGFGKILSVEEREFHISLEKETQSFIKMMTYNDLVIKVSEIDGNLMIS